jgi:hypothetical protein
MERVALGFSIASAAALIVLQVGLFGTLVPSVRTAAYLAGALLVTAGFAWGLAVIPELLLRRDIGARTRHWLFAGLFLAFALMSLLGRLALAPTTSAIKEPPHYLRSGR